MGNPILGLGALRAGVAYSIVMIFRHKSCNACDQTTWVPFNSLRLSSKGPPGLQGRAGPLRGPSCSPSKLSYAFQEPVSLGAPGRVLESLSPGLGHASLGVGALRSRLACGIDTIFRYKFCNIWRQTTWVPITRLRLGSLKGTLDHQGPLGPLRAQACSETAEARALEGTQDHYRRLTE